jgi:peptidoglycan/xylan/chitin deacetylase (PgdA/CDA1 family)
VKVGAVAAVLLATAWGVSACASGHADTTVIRVQHPKLVVSLTFDDAYVDQYLYLRPLLRLHHMKATYDVNTTDSAGNKSGYI